MIQNIEHFGFVFAVLLLLLLLFLYRHNSTSCALPCLACCRVSFSFSSSSFFHAPLFFLFFFLFIIIRFRYTHIFFFSNIFMHIGRCNGFPCELFSSIRKWWRRRRRQHQIQFTTMYVMCKWKKKRSWTHPDICTHKDAKLDLSQTLKPNDTRS